MKVLETSLTLEGTNELLCQEGLFEINETKSGANFCDCIKCIKLFVSDQEMCRKLFKRQSLLGQLMVHKC